MCLTGSSGRSAPVRAGVESEMELAYAALHQLCAPMLGRLEVLPGPQHDALRIAFGMSSGPVPDRFQDLPTRRRRPGPHRPAPGLERPQPDRARLSGSRPKTTTKGRGERPWPRHIRSFPTKWSAGFAAGRPGGREGWRRRRRYRGRRSSRQAGTPGSVQIGQELVPVLVGVEQTGAGHILDRGDRLDTLAAG
jgi:hypothetical protein